MKSNHLMLQSALNRLQYWKDELVKAEAMQDSARIHECARFVREYGVLIEEMTDTIKGDEAG